MTKFIANDMSILSECIVREIKFTTEDEKNKSSANSEWGENSSVFNTGFENQEAVSDTKLKKVIDTGNIICYHKVYTLLETFKINPAIKISCIHFRGK